MSQTFIPGRAVLRSILCVLGLLALTAAPLCRAAGIPKQEIQFPPRRAIKLPPRPGRALTPLLGGKIPNTGAYEREYWYWYERSRPTGVFPHTAEEMMRRRADAYRSRFAANLGGLGLKSFQAQAFTNPWSELGPRSARPGTGPGEVSGRVMAILLQKAQNRILIGTASGGIWKRSLSPGSRWEPKSDFASSLSVGALAADALNPNVIFAGTGEPGVNLDAFNGGGILKSTNGGDTWVRIDDGSMGSKKITTIWVDPRNGNRLLASALYDGLYESTNGGVTWNRIRQSTAMGFAVSPTDPNRIILSDTEPIGSTTSDLLLSTNGGVSFNAINGGWRGGGATVGRGDLAWSTVDPNKVYCSFAPPLFGSDGGRSGIYRSTDGGATWARVFDTQHGGAATGEEQGWYNNPVAPSPANPDLVFYGGVNMYRGTVGSAGSKITHWFDGTGLPYIHADQHAFAFDPTAPNTLYVGNDGGVFLTTDGGSNWTDYNAGLGCIQFYFGAAGKSNALASLIGGTQDNGTLMPQSGQTWSEVTGGDGFGCAVDPQNDRVIYSSVYSSIYFMSSDGGATFRRLPSIPAGANEELPFVTPLSIDPSNGTRIYGAAQRVYRGISDRSSTVSWTALSANPLFPDNFGLPVLIRAIAVAPSNGDVIYASGEGSLARTTTGGEPWTMVSPPGGQFITDAAVHPTDPNYVVVTRSGFTIGQVMRSLNGGQTWTDISPPGLGAPANAIVLRPNGARLDCFVGTDVGVFHTDLNVAPLTWTPVGTGLPNVVVFDLALSHNATKLLAITHGRGMFIVDIPPQQLDLTAPNGGEVIPLGQPLDIRWSSTGFAPDHMVRLDLSRDGGFTFPEVLAAATADDGQFTWTTTGLSNRCRVRITSLELPDVTDMSAADFSIATGSLQVVSPNGGEDWIIGSNQSIRWNSTDVVGTSPTVRIDLSRDGGMSWTTILPAAPNAPGANLATWTVTGPESRDCLVRIVANTLPFFSDVGDGLFRIRPPSAIQLLSPVGGETLRAGSNFDIRWNSVGFSGNVLLEFSRNGGATWEMIAGDVPNSDGNNSYDWSVPLVTTRLARVRVTSINEPNVQSASPTIFTIETPMIDVLGPVGGQLMLVGQTEMVIWSSQGLDEDSPVDISLSRDGGMTWELIAEGEPNSGLFFFVPTLPQTANARIRVQSQEEPGAVDDSSDFRIESPTLEVRRANGGEKWARGSQQSIQWRGNVVGRGTVDVLLSRDGGATWVTILKDVRNDGGALWGVHGALTKNALIEIVWNDPEDSGIRDRSNRTFRIVKKKGTKTFNPPRK